MPNSPKNSTPPHGARHTAARPTAHGARSLQLKPAAPHAQPKPPSPPPQVYRPNPQPVVLQRKTALTHQPHAASAHANKSAPTVKSAPTAPPVYRPHSAPKVLQRKTHGVSESLTAKKSPAVQARVATPAPPPVYRPAPAPQALQLKSAAPPRQPAVNPPRASQAVARPVAAPSATPVAARRPSVIQPMLEVVGYNLPFGGGGGGDDDPEKNGTPHNSHYDEKVTFEKSKKRKRRSSKNDGIDSANVLEGSTRKSTRKQSVFGELDSISVSKSSMNTRNKEKRQTLERRYNRRGILPVRPPTPPVTDTRGYNIWNGQRNSIHWYPGFMADWWNANGPKNHTSCAYHDETCDGGMQIDHVQPALHYILNMAGVAPQVVCDGTHHWNAYVLDTPATINSSYPLNPSPNDTIRTAYHHNNNLIAICQHHNGSKGSHRRGLDDPRPPVLVGPCNCQRTGTTSKRPKKLRRTKSKKEENP